MTSPPAPPDAELVRLAAAGRDDAFTQLVERWHGRVYRWALGLTDDHDDADDVAQQVFVRLYSHLSRFRGDARFSTWLYQVTTNAARDSLRRRQRRARAVARLAREPDVTTAAPDPAIALERADALQAARAVLAALPERQRAVFDLVELQGYKPQEAAALLGIGAVTARTHLLRARRALRATFLHAHETVER